MAGHREEDHPRGPEPPDGLPDGERHGEVAEGEGTPLAQAGTDESQAKETYPGERRWN